MTYYDTVDNINSTGSGSHLFHGNAQLLHVLQCPVDCCCDACCYTLPSCLLNDAHTHTRQGAAAECICCLQSCGEVRYSLPASADTQHMPSLRRADTTLLMTLPPQHKRAPAFCGHY